MSIQQELEIDFLDPEVLRNPHQALRQLRAQQPVYHVRHAEMGGRPWMVTRYDDAIAVLNDPRLTKDRQRLPHDEEDMEMQAAATINRHMLTVDPPDHTRLRGIVHKAFTPAMIRRLEGRIQEIADGLIDRMLQKPQADLIADFAVPLPVTVIAELLGVPHEDQDKFRHWSQVIVLQGIQHANPEEVGVAVLEFIMYFHELFDQRRAEPKDDLITGLVQTEEAGNKLDAQELISTVFLLLVAGHETTVNLIANGTLALLQHPDQLQKLRENPDLIRSAVEEMLRFDGPIGISTMRWTLEPFEIDGVTIPAGEMVVASLLGVNRDPGMFPDPDTFDISRPPGKHLAFGNGIHYCLGAPLARLEGAIAINTLVQRVPNLSLAVDAGELEWNPTLLLHGMKSMPVNTR